jgi:sulfate permease, SulP family
VVTSATVPILGWTDVATVDDLTSVPNSLPLPVAPTLDLVPALLIPALSLAFVGLVQGAAISAGILNPDGERPDASRDFVGQGAGNVAAGRDRRGERLRRR